MNTIFDSARTVKPARRFGTGIPSARRMPYTAADAAWWAANSPANRYGFDVVSQPVRAIDCPENRNVETVEALDRHDAFIGQSDEALEFAAGCFETSARLDAGLPIC